MQLQAVAGVAAVEDVEAVGVEAVAAVEIKITKGYLCTCICHYLKSRIWEFLVVGWIILFDMR
jgi:hypothetical protein